MVTTCVVRGCKSSRSPGCNTVFHSFPTDKVRKKLWLSVIPLKNQFYNGAKICSLHFKDTDYETTTGSLKKTAVPICNYETELLKVEQSDDDDSESSEDYIYTKSNLKKTIVTDSDFENKSAKVKKSQLETVEQSCDDEPEPPSFVFEVNSNDSQIIASAPSSAFSTIGKRSKGVQANIKTSRELKLMRENKILKQRLFRQDKYLKNLKSLFALMKKSYKAREEND